MADDADGWSNAETAAVARHIRNTPALLNDVMELINSLAGDGSMDRMVAEAAAEVRAVVLGLWHDVRDDSSLATDATTAMFADVGDITQVDWTQLGESFLLDVVTQAVRDK